MKANDIINEGPVDFAKKVAAGVRGAKAGWQQASGQQTINKVSADSIKQWNQIAGQLNQAGTPPTQQQLQSFIKKIAPTSAIPPIADVSNATAVNDYITKSIAQHFANKQTGQTGQPQQPPQQAATNPAAPQGKVEPTLNNTPTAEPEQAPAKPSANEFAKKLQADFEKFSNAGGSIGAPAVKQLLKNMWMQAGGVRAESKTNRKKSV